MTASSRFSKVLPGSSLKYTVVISLIAVVIVAAVAASLAVNILIKYQMAIRFADEKEAVIESLSLAVKPALESGEASRLEQALSSILTFESVDAIIVKDASGTVLADLREDEHVENIETEVHNVFSSGQQTGSFEVSFSSATINAFSEDLTLFLILTLVAFLLIAGVGVYLILRFSVISPIERMTQTVRSITPDNLSARVSLSSRNEIGTLAQSFNTMADNLESSQKALVQARDSLEIKVAERTRGERKRADQLRTINEVGRQISSILSIEELLPQVVNLLQETFRFYSVYIFTTGPAEDTLTLRAGTGHDRGIGTFSIRLGTGIVGVAAAGSGPVNVSDVNNYPDYIPYDPLPDTRSELAVPIRIGEETLGVLDIQSVETGSFDDVDVFSISTLADQMAVAMENARLYQETRDIAIIEERNRMAREIHDTLAQGFTGILMQLEAAEQALPGDPVAVHSHLERARELARESLNEARRSVRALRPQQLEQQNLTETLRRLLNDFSRDTSIEVKTTLSGKLDNLPAPLENSLLRITQEALTNIRRHAAARHVEFSLDGTTDRTVLAINDDGVGFNTGQTKTDRFGLVGMKERVHEHNGNLDIISSPGHGTSIKIEIPRTGVLQ